MACKSEVMSLGKGSRASDCSVGKRQCFEFDASGNWQVEDLK